MSSRFLVQGGWESVPAGAEKRARCLWWNTIDAPNSSVIKELIIEDDSHPQPKAFEMMGLWLVNELDLGSLRSGN
ncbi:hypothetical protein N9181_01350 [bacterium]|nr:hypothetical protein [bacterium]